MKKSILIITMLLPFSSAIASPYIGGNLALGSNNRSLFGDSASFIAGYDLKLNSDFSLGVEAEYRDFGKETYWGYLNQFRGKSVRAKSFGITLKPTYHFTFEQRDFYLSPLLGMQRFEEKWRSNTTQGTHLEHQYDDLSFQWGMEFGIYVSPHLSFNSGFKMARPSLLGGKVDYDQFFMGLNFHF